MTKWSDRDLPVLKAVAAAEDAGLDQLDVEELSKDLDMPSMSVARSLVLLHDHGFIGGEPVKVMDPKPCIAIIEPHLLVAGLRALGEWPSDDPYEELVRVLEERINQETNEQERTKLQRVRDDLYLMGKGAAGALLTSYLQRMAGLG